MAQENTTSWHLLSRLRTVVKKVTFLMNSNVNHWRLVAAFIGGGGVSSRRRLSFGEQLGLTAIVSSPSDDDDHREQEDENLEFFDSGSSSSSSRMSNGSRELRNTKSFCVQRTMSFPEEDDVDKRAEMFIENFYRQLRLERQISLELRYKRDRSFGSSDSGSNSS